MIVRHRRPSGSSLSPAERKLNFLVNKVRAVLECGFFKARTISKAESDKLGDDFMNTPIEEIVKIVERNYEKRKPVAIVSTP